MISFNENLFDPQNKFFQQIFSKKDSILNNFINFKKKFKITENSDQATILDSLINKLDKNYLPRNTTFNSMSNIRSKKTKDFNLIHNVMKELLKDQKDIIRKLELRKIMKFNTALDFEETRFIHKIATSINEELKNNISNDQLKKKLIFEISMKSFKTKKVEHFYGIESQPDDLENMDEGINDNQQDKEGKLF